MAEGGSAGGRRMEEHGDGYSSKLGGFAVAREYLSALRVRPVGGRLAQEMSARRCCCFFFSSRRRHTRLQGNWSSDVCSSDLRTVEPSSRSTLHLEALSKRPP